MYTPTWDCDYGNYRDMNNDYGWYDNFNPSNKQCLRAMDEYRWREREIVEEIAESFGLNTDGWDNGDYEMFKEMVGIE